MNQRANYRFLAIKAAVLLFSIFSVWAASGASSPPVRFITGLSPFLDDAAKDDVYRRVIALLIEDLPLDSSLTIYDAYNLQTIAAAEIPNARAFRSAKTRANQFAEPIQKLRQFLAEKHPSPSGTKLSFKNAVRFPQFMDFVGEHLVQSNRQTVVIVLGSPLYMDSKEPEFSMVDGYFPSDGHLSANRDKSVFGLKDRGASLPGVLVYFGCFGDPWVSELHKEKVERFWSLYLQGQGSRLAAFTGDLSTLFNAAKSGEISRAPEFQVDASQKKIEMLRITRDIGVADWITEETISNAALKPPTRLTGPMKIGIRWKGNIDLDLYARPSPGAERLYFEKVRSPDGYYFKDHRTSPEREYEFIEFERPVNALQVEAGVNFFEGRAPGGAEGEVRIEFEGRIYSSHFRIPADHGNEGREGSRQKDFWSVLNVPKILGLDKEELQARGF